MTRKRDKNEKKYESTFDLQADEHVLSVEALCRRLETDPVKGLTTEQAESKRKEYGDNILSPAKGMNLWHRFFVHNFQGADIIACVGVILCITNYMIECIANVVVEADIEKIYVAITLSMFFIFVGTYSFIIERKAVKILDQLRIDMSKITCLVIRDGKLKLLNIKELTIGDLVEIHCGDRIHADMRVIATRNFQVDNSSLTGDSVPIVSTVEQTDKNPLRTRNLIFSSTFAVAGKCKGIVTKIGDSTVIGHLERESTFLKQVYTPLIHRFNKVVLLYCAIGVCFSLTFTFLFMRLNFKFLDVSTVYIATFIAIIPEKLLICLHTNHILAASRMQKKNCLIKHFEGIETLGNCSVICTGKSGILTESEFSVSQVWLGDDVLDVETLTPEQISFESFGILVRSLHLNLSRYFASNFNPEDDERLIRNDTEHAIVSFLRKMGSRQDSKRVYEVMFTPSRLYQLSIHKVDYDPRFLLVAMGAPEIILEKCSTILINGVEVKIDGEIKTKFISILKQMANNGLQIIGVSEVFLPLRAYPANFKFDYEQPGGFPRHKYRFVGLVSLKNSIKTTVPDSINSCRNARIKIVLMSGDYPVTVETVARKTGIISQESSTEDVNSILERISPDLNTADINNKNITVTMTGETLEGISEDEFKFILYNFNEIVISRVRPHQKLLVVKYFQENGEIVAATGKTLSDSYALKKANIGIVPLNASDITRQSADIVLKDGNFTCIEHGIEEGRLVFENFRKSLCFDLATNVPKFLPFFLFMILQIPLPLGAISILCIDIGIDFLSAVSLGYETPEPCLMTKPPRGNANIITKGMILRSYFHIGILQASVGLLAYFAVMGSNGFLPDRLIGLRNEWLDQGIDDLEDSYKQEWSFEQRMQLEANGHTAYFYAIIILQITNLISSRTNYSSIIHQRMNWVLVITIGVEFCFASILASAHLGWLDQSLKIREIKWSRLLLILPFALFIIAYDEVRKWLIRRNPEGWTARHLRYL